ncbi:MAG: aldo/keto reductase [Pirellulaceae bacterium]|nr:aldo/keto reductase [Pirellulaceae bacterium]
MVNTTRREFLVAAAASLAAANVKGIVWGAQEKNEAGIPTRVLGRTGQRVTIVGMGGAHIGAAEDQEAIAIMQEAVDQGMTFFDNAWDYRLGRCEELMGKALASGGRRQKVFLMSKNCNRDYQGSMQHLEDSLRRLKTDYLDLWQFHEVDFQDAPARIFDEGGMKAALEAKKSGKVRFIGFTGHKDIDLHADMLNRSDEWDTCQMPINILDVHYRSFQKNILPVCTQRNIGVIGMKALACGRIPTVLGLDASLCRRFALSLPISTLVCGIQSRENLQQDLAVARNFTPLTEEEVIDFINRTETAGKTGEHEQFKTTTHFDGPYHREQHRS